MLVLASMRTLEEEECNCHDNTENVSLRTNSMKCNQNFDLVFRTFFIDSLYSTQALRIRCTLRELVDTLWAVWRMTCAK